MRASSWSARAGMIASRSGSVPSTGVSLTASRYESVAAITTLPGSNRTRMPVRTGRLSSRDALRPTREIVSTSASRSTECSASDSTSGRRGKSSAEYVCSRYVAVPDVTTTAASSGRCSIETSLSGSERAMSSRRRPWNHHGSLARDLRVDRAPQRNLHVGGGEVQPAGFGAQLDASEHEHRGARRDTSCDGRQLGCEIVLRDRNPQPGPHHYL